MKKLLLFFYCFLFSPIISAETYALIIGINDYQYEDFSDLKGAVNDANLIYDSLQKMGIPEKNLIKLINQQADKATIKKQWRQLIQKSKPNDTLIFTFAGHGTQEPDLNGDEKLRDAEDDKDETLVLAGFAKLPKKAHAERLVDDELHRLFQEANGRKVIYVVDACHSGDSFRSLDPRSEQVWRERKVPMLNIQLSETEGHKTDSKVKEMDLENFYFFSATESKKVSMEGKIAGKQHGALSWVFAKSLSKADANDDQQLSVEELSGFIHEEVKQLTNSRQFTEIRPRNGSSILFSLGKRLLQKKAANKTEEKIKVKLLGKGKPNWLADLTSLDVVKEDTDFIWDMDKGDIISQGDVVTRHISTRQQLERIVERFLLLKTLKNLMKNHYLETKLTGKRYKFGDAVSFSIHNLKYKFLLQFNITGNGAIQCYPLIKASKYKTTSFEAEKPAGKDVLVSLVINEVTPDLQKLLDNQVHCPKVYEITKALPKLLKDKKYQMGSVDLFVNKD